MSSPPTSGHPARKQVIIYTDGGCRPNPGPGGYGVVLRCGDYRKELSGGFRLSTNNRMELMAAIVGLEALKYPCQVLLYSDSQYLVNAMEKGWATRWQANGWRRGERLKEAVKNPDLWQRLMPLCERHQVRFAWVKGHSGEPDNERCDELASAALAAPHLPPDELYERTEAIAQ